MRVVRPCGDPEILPRQHIRLLLLEDSPRDAELARHFLRRELDCTLTVVQDEASFRSSLAASAPDVILSDYTLCGFDGMHALRIAQQIAPETPFILLSGSIGEERAVEALREGATDYVLKDRLPRLPSAIIRALSEREERSLRHRIERALRASEQRFEYAAAATQEVIWDCDLATARVWFNDAFRDAWGYDVPQREAPLEWFLQRIHSDDRDDVIASFDEALEEKERWHAEFRLSRANGSYGYVMAHGMIVRDAVRCAVRVIGSIFDLTERLQLEQQLDQAKRVESLGRVATTVAHEFNNVLMAIAPLVTVLQRAPDPPAIEQAALRIAEAVSRGRRLSEQILRFGKPAHPELEPVDLAQCLEQFAPDFQSLGGNAINVTLSIRDAPLPVSIDRDQLHQVLSNLILNAREAMQSGGAVRIVAERGIRFACITVSDEGAGIPPEILPRIFEPLFTTRRSGTGLGLAVAQQIIVRHRGSIEVTSTGGGGTTFRILLPLVVSALH